ncbi:MAG: phosphoribosylanthranilate isomerase [Acidobacteriota bacterium]
MASQTKTSQTVASRPKVKICGVTSPEEAILAVDLGADLIGLNFYPPSPRYVEAEPAAEIAAAVRGRARRVGVFVNPSANEVERLVAEVGLDLLQFHGDESPEQIRPFADRAIKAFRVRSRVDAESLAGFEGVWGMLIDSRHPQLYGGTGESWRFETLPDLTGPARRTFIAGGLGPSNVARAIRAARPYGIDLCSGVEAEPGKKDPELLRRLFEEIQHGETSTAA